MDLIQQIPSTDSSSLLNITDANVDTYTSITYSVEKHNNDTVQKVAYSSTIKDADKMIDTHYNNTVKNNEQNESFSKLFKNRDNIYEQIGNSKNKKDWTVQEYHNSSFQKKYVDKYTNHKFDECIPPQFRSLRSASTPNLLL